jgi:hypothetical protein
VTPEEAIEIETSVKRAYQLVFNTPHGEAVLLDLKRICRANETCVVPGDRDRTFVLEGRREVYLRIRDYLDLTPEELVVRHSPL